MAVYQVNKRRIQRPIFPFLGPMWEPCPVAKVCYVYQYHTLIIASWWAWRRFNMSHYFVHRKSPKLFPSHTWMSLDRLYKCTRFQFSIWNNVFQFETNLLSNKVQNTTSWVWLHDSDNHGQDQYEYTHIYICIHSHIHVELLSYI